ncbi:MULTISPECIES: P-loop ATPase, Sll1717 family [unclassified Pseudomonas]|uniref:P-loop ATPase, Sll1717 family n=1 Tax=unclassified Pseudomonas TaxID=196821 RepID=UPI0011AF626F|nr:MULTISPECIES: hypothetical protein [unclassified Pseudomonas]
MDDIPTIEELMMSLQYYVPTGTAEGEKYILQEAFVQTHEYADIIAPPIGSPRLLVGKKGSGKSAILDFTLRFLKDAGLPGLLIKPLNLELSAMGENAPSGELTRIAYNAIMKAVSDEIAKQLPSMVTGDNAELLHLATAEGVVRADFVSKFARILNGFSKPFTGYDFSTLLPSATTVSCKRLERLVKSNIETSKTAFYILIDDTDQVANPGTRNHLNRIWAFILAARELSLNNDKIRCVITLRDEIWRALEKEGSGQRDQIDHFRPLVYRVNPSLDHVQSIIEKRLILAAKRAGYETVDANYSLFFDGDMPRMPFSEKRSSWPDLIKYRSRERPRDAVQLVNMLVQIALRNDAKKINEDIFSTVMPIYSKERAELVAGEYEAECPQMIHVIRSFHKLEFKHGSFLADTETVRAHLIHIQSAFTITMNGVALKPTREEDILSLWSLLFQAGVFYPRVSDSRQKEGYRFVFPHEEPGLVTKARWNDLQQSLWEIHPVFRDFLISEQKEQSARFGLASKATRFKSKR